jgi:hypothetical protein
MVISHVPHRVSSGVGYGGSEDGMTFQLSAPPSERQVRRENRFPQGWDEDRVQKVLAHYEEQTKAEAVTEDEATFDEPTETVMEVPTVLVPVIRELIATHHA